MSRFQGTGRPGTWYKNYVLAVAELKKLGKTFENRSYPGEGHGFRNA